MFMMTMGSGQVMGFPDTCLTPTPAPTPMPYPNTAQSSMAPKAVTNVLCSNTPTVNMSASISMSNGNQAGVGMGSVSKTIMGTANWTVGSVTTFVGGTPVQRMTSTANCNCMGSTANVPGTAIAPSQSTVLVLS